MSNSVKFPHAKVLLPDCTNHQMSSIETHWRPSCSDGGRKRVKYELVVGRINNWPQMGKKKTGLRPPKYLVFGKGIS